MLDPMVLISRLTQGRPAAEMTLARPGGALPLVEGQPATPGPSSAPADARADAVDVQEVALRVYALLRQDLAVARERRGRR